MQPGLCSRRLVTHYDPICSEKDMTTSWVNPLTKMPQTGSQVEARGGGGRQAAASQSDYEHLPLPEGWEKAHTANGTAYFIDHHRRTTCWTGGCHSMQL